ncbi:thymidine phosphorylase [Micromonospora taraxaci]|uniref:thymidine phosphorylase n=1 Tax=Micromonospora taraxaci TaxID=1316803 RepID=UPI0033E3DD8E
MTATGSHIDPLTVINRKRRGDRLTDTDITGIVESYLAGDIADYQMAAWLMAVACRGMDPAETSALTQALIGPARLHLGATTFVADKHSTGGVGDKTTLVLAPLLASLGIPVAKMSGRGLGHAGGTIDKLEAIPGLRLPQSHTQFRHALHTVGLAMTGHTADLAPGDQALYRLRDVTGTVESLPLIAASIMSKKIAAGASAVVLDVKAGSGALLHRLEDALDLATMMVAIGQQADLPTRAVVSNMDQPLGRAVGNTLEVAEAIAALKGEPVPDLVPLVLHLGGLLAAQAWPDRQLTDIRATMVAALGDGRALTSFRRWVGHHGGNVDLIDHPEWLPRAARIETLTASTSGWVSHVDAAVLGSLAQHLGAGRTRLNQAIDHTVGLRLHARVGDRITAGARLVELHLPVACPNLDHITQLALSAFTITEVAVPMPSLIHHTL